MANGKEKILTAEQEAKLRKPIEDHVGKIQAKIDGLRANGTDKVLSLQSQLDSIKRDKTITKEEKESRIAGARTELEKAQAEENKNKDEVTRLIKEAETYIKAHFDQDYYQVVKKSCELEKAAVKESYQKKLAELEKEHKQILSKLSGSHEIKEEKYVYKNRLFDAKMELEKNLQLVKEIGRASCRERV